MKDTSNTATFTVHMFIYTCTCTLGDIVLHQYISVEMNKIVFEETDYNTHVPHVKN